MQILLPLINNPLHLLLLNPIRAQHLLQWLLTERLERAPMVLIGARCDLSQDFTASPRLVISLLTLLTKHMSNIVPIHLLELISINLLSKLLFPEGVCFIHCQPEALDKETQLKSSKMFQMMFVSHNGKQGLHTRGERASGVEIKIGQVDLISIGRGLSFVKVEIYSRVVGEVDEHGLESLILEDTGQILIGLD